MRPKRELRAMKSSATLLAVGLGLLLHGPATAQVESRKAAIVSLAGLYGGAVQFNHESGPYDLMSGRHAMGYGLSVGVRERVWSGRLALGVDLEYVRLPFTFRWQINAKEVFGVDYPSQREGYSPERMGLAVFWAGGDLGLSRGPQLPYVHVGFGLGWSSLDFYPRFGSRSVQTRDQPDIRYNIFTMTSEHRNGFVPLLRLGLGKEWQFGNTNRLGVTAFVQWSWVDDFNSGTYLAYPGTTAESRGTWKQGLNYIGLKVHYAMGFGPGKVPRHLRGTE